MVKELVCEGCGKIIVLDEAYEPQLGDQVFCEDCFQKSPFRHFRTAQRIEGQWKSGQDQKDETKMNAERSGPLGWVPGDSWTIKEEWEQDGLRCMVVLNFSPPNKRWYSGYVGLMKGHPDWGKTLDDVDVEVHGGLTLSRQGSEPPFEGEDIWWFGWDARHAADETDPNWPLPGGHKWTLEEATEETRKLAQHFDRIGGWPK